MEKNLDPQILHHLALKSVSPSMRYDGKEDFGQWQKRARARLRSLMGLDRIKAAPDDGFSINETVIHDGYTEYQITFMSEEGHSVPCNLRIPKGKEGKIPMVICLQGHSTGYHISLGKPIHPGDEETISGGDRDFAVQIVKEGYASLAIEQRGFGICGGDENGPRCLIPTMTALLLGRTTIAERVFDISRAIDVIPSHFEQIDENAIACMGNSGGGTATIYASATDERISLSMPSCALCTFADSIGAMHHCSCNYIPGIALDFDMGDICGLIAPRSLIVVSGAEDPIFPHDGVEESVRIARKYYAASGTPDGCDWVEGSEGHRFYAKDAWPVFHARFDKA